MAGRRAGPRQDVWVLLSGGIDSAACLTFYIHQKRPVDAVFIDYGQKSARREEKAACSIARHYGIDLTKLTWRGGHPQGPGLIYGRNAFLLLAALLEKGGTPGLIALGIHAGVAYYDCSRPFVQRLQGIFDGYTDGRVRIAAPFLEWDKRSIWQYCKQERVPLELTYSCEKGVRQPCGDCLSCRDLEVLRAL